MTKLKIKSKDNYLVIYRDNHWMNVTAVKKGENILDALEKHLDHLDQYITKEIEKDCFYNGHAMETYSFLMAYLNQWSK